jgi:DNA polymerase (family 10)
MKEGWEYFGISDHSQTAAYAGGLQPERVLQQHKEIDLLNEKLASRGFTVFKGIESDILQDGSLDYEDDILGAFDFVVASIHGQFPKDADTATARLIKAVENPFTTILGHPTGRLLLVREGYPIHHAKVIDACAANGVVIEINANPYRLDLDWTWIPYALEKGVMISVNPDAHAMLGLKDSFWGVEAARKGGLTREMTFNAKTREEMAEWFAARKR